MLKIRNFFALFFIYFCIFFIGLFYFVNEQYINNTIKSTYEQKLKTLNDTLKFNIIKTLNVNNIKDFSQQTRADFIIEKDKKIISSLDDFEFFKNQFNTDFTHEFFNNKEIYYKAYQYEGYKYIIIVYPKINAKIQDFWIKNILIFLLFLAILTAIYIFIFNFFKKYFQELLLFIKNIKSQSEFHFTKNFFYDLNSLNLRLLKIKKLFYEKELQNKKQAKKIKMKNTQLSNLISAISHELKNPLSVINLSLQSLEEEHNETMRKFLLEKIHKQSVKINQLTHKLNFVFNLNTISLNKEKFDLYALSKDIVENFNESRIKIQGEQTFIKADSFLIEQVIINLISNALKYSQKGIFIEVKNQEFTIQDQGIGIEEKYLKLITKKFYKIDTSQNNSFGLGLFLVKKILTLHKSSLKIQSTPKKCSIFSFTINSL
ncbi:sensor histidine kinase [Campylobacter sp. RM16704]|uniref:sensor histidine kinase n=1 Tax=Campylobacter sp. RM16704 TaxID=1500960 RepID=UPI00057F539E|nr:HAMP domain-containing sensor histidine kinase [Campylobacter sp. RM16704]AJC86200.1 two-component system histidine kinase [Campylobacter sp. RM16704]